MAAKATGRLRSICPDCILTSAYDAAQVNWGSTWRMPTLAEFQALKEATYWLWDATDKGCYVYTPNPSTDAGKYNNGTGSYSKDSALLFFPSPGYGNGDQLITIGSHGHDWSSTIYSLSFQSAYLLSFNPNEALHDNIRLRCYGHSIRPVSD